MLVLSRHRDGKIHIGEEIVITVVEIRGDKVRLGIQAPDHVAVHRAEVFEAMKAKAPDQPIQPLKHQVSNVAKMAAALKGGK